MSQNISCGQLQSESRKVFEVNSHSIVNSDKEGDRLKIQTFRDRVTGAIC